MNTKKLAKTLEDDELGEGATDNLRNIELAGLDVWCCSIINMFSVIVVEGGEAPSVPDNIIISSFCLN
jgi:hypothetical protein